MLCQNFSLAGHVIVTFHAKVATWAIFKIREDTGHVNGHAKAHT